MSGSRLGKDFHHAADQVFGIHNLLSDDLNIHGGLARLACALAIHAVLADQHQGIGQQIERDGKPPAGNTHHELVFFELFATLFVYAHNFSLRALC